MAKTEQMVHIRMPMALHRKLSREAKYNSQTLSGEILRRLEMSLRTDMAFPGEHAAEAKPRTPEKFFAQARELFERYNVLFAAAVRLDTLQLSEAEQKSLREVLPYLDRSERTDTGEQTK